LVIGISPRIFARLPKDDPLKYLYRALSCGLTKHNLVLSPQHRTLDRFTLAGTVALAAKILVFARLLTQIDGIKCESDSDEVRYLHILFGWH